MRLLTQEWKKLIGSGQTIALFITVVAVGVVLTFFDGVPILGEPESPLDVQRVTNLYTGTIVVASIFPAILGALSVTSEFRLGTAIATFLQTPNRTRVLFAKMLIAGVGGAISGALSMLAAYATAFVIVSRASSAAAPDVATLIGTVLGVVTTGFALGMFGAAVGALIRAQIASLAVVIGWLVFIDNALSGILGSAGIVLPYQLASFALSAPGDGTYFSQIIRDGTTAFVGLIGVFAWAVIIGLIASVTTLRKDID